MLAAAREALADAALVVIEDLHWADDATLDVIALVGRRLERGCLVITARPDARREVRRVLEHFGLKVSRLIRTSYGPFALGDLEAGQVEEVRQHDVVAFRKTLG